MCNFGVRSRFLDVIYGVHPPNGSPVRLKNSCSTQLNMNFQQLIKTESRINFTIVGILIFISRINFMLSRVKHENSFITSGPDHQFYYIHDKLKFDANSNLFGSLLNDRLHLNRSFYEHIFFNFSKTGF